MTLARIEKPHEKYAWTIFFALGIFELVFTSVVVVLVYADSSVLKSLPGMALTSSSPGVLGNIAVGGLGMSVFGLGIAFKPFRAGERWAWYVSWIWPITFLVGTANDLSLGFLPPVVVLATPVTIAGLLLPYGKFFPRRQV